VKECRQESQRLISEREKSFEAHKFKFEHEFEDILQEKDREIE
jgi:hypothetical protein